MTPDQRQALLDLYAAAFDWEGRVAEDVFDQAEELRKALGCPFPPEVADISCLFHEAWHPKGFPSLLCTPRGDFKDRMERVFDSEALAEQLQDRLVGLITRPDPRTDISQQIYRELGVAGVEIAREMLRKFCGCPHPPMARC